MLPRWEVPPSMAPNTSMPAAGLRLLHGTEHSVVYSPGASERAACNLPRQSGCNGTYNHAPLITAVEGVLGVGWHSWPAAAERVSHRHQPVHAGLYPDQHSNLRCR